MDVILARKCMKAGGCSNVAPLLEHAAAVTETEEAAKTATTITDHSGQAETEIFPGGCTPGRIVCKGMLKSEYVGDMCRAELEQPNLPGERGGDIFISSVASVEQIPGFHLHPTTSQ